MSQVMIRDERFSSYYQAVVLPSLFKEQYSDCEFSSSCVLQEIDTNNLISIVAQSRQTLLIACDELKSVDLIQLIMQKADKGLRVYLLLGNAKANQTAIDTLSGRCLVRTGVKQKGTLILVDHTTTQHQGLLLMGQGALIESGESDWAISLDEQQLDDSFRSFCKLFWEEAANEYLQQNTPQKKEEHPDGLVVTNHSHQLSGTLKNCLDESLNSLIGVSDFTLEIEDNSFQLLLSSSSSSIKRFARSGVSLTDNRIPTLLFSESGNWLLPDSPDFDITNWCLKLSAQQSLDLEAAYRKAATDAAWQYSEQLAMSELVDGQSLRFADQPDLVRSLEQIRSHTLDDIYTESIDSFLNDAADTLAADSIQWQRDFMAHKIDYRVAIHPPYCSSQAKKDFIYDEWKKSEKNWQDQLVLLMTKQKKIDESQAGISERLKGFVKSFLLGQGQSAKKLNHELSVLQGWSVTQATPAERSEYKNRLDVLLSNVTQRGKETALKLDEAEQHHQWEVIRNKLLEAVERSNKLLLDKKDNQALVLSNKNQQERNTDDDFYANWVNSIGLISDEKMEGADIHDLKSDQFLPEVLPDNKDEKSLLLKQAREQCICKKRDVLCSMTIEQAEQWKNKLKDKTFTKHYPELNSVFTNRELTIKKIMRECNEANKLVLDAKQAVEYSHNKLEDHGAKFIYQARQGGKALEQQLGLKGDVSKVTSFVWPDEELPDESTELRSLNKQRFLVIFDLENIDRARNDAERLNAKVVCDKGVVNA